jgi:hypothetical protein
MERRKRKYDALDTMLQGTTKEEKHAEFAAYGEPTQKAVKITRKAASSEKESLPLKEVTLSAAEAISLLSTMGYVVTPPDPSVIQARLEQTPDALGVITHAAKAIKPYPVKISHKVFWLDLRFPHCINGVNYGPGRTYIAPQNPRSSELIGELLYKDRICAEQEERFFDTTSRCHLIVSKRDVSGREAAIGHPVPSNFFDGGDLMNAPVFKEFSNSDVRR